MIVKKYLNFTSVKTSLICNYKSQTKTLLHCLLNTMLLELGMTPIQFHAKKNLFLFFEMNYYC